MLWDDSGEFLLPSGIAGLWYETTGKVRHPMSGERHPRRVSVSRQLSNNPHTPPRILPPAPHPGISAYIRGGSIRHPAPSSHTNPDCVKLDKQPSKLFYQQITCRLFFSYGFYRFHPSCRRGGFSAEPTLTTGSLPDPQIIYLLQMTARYLGV